MKVEHSAFGMTPDNQEANLFKLENSKGVVLQFTNYGGTITSIFVPDKKGEMEDVVLGFDSLDGYIRDHPYIGALVGRYANRIAQGRFELDGKEYKLARNEGRNHLHGGLKGFDKILWDCSDYTDINKAGVLLSYMSYDMEEGYPGNLKVDVHLYLSDDNEVGIEYKAVTDKSTFINLTHHGYFNLNGAQETIYKHNLMINASRYLVCDNELIPTGKIAKVDGTVLDFRHTKPIGRDIGQVSPGYDHTYILDRKSDDLELASRVYDSESGRIMEVYTTEPSIQFYSSNFLKGITGKNTIRYRKHLALCLEAQHYPDSPNHSGFPSTLLKPGETYYQHTVYKFLPE